MTIKACVIWKLSSFFCSILSPLIIFSDLSMSKWGRYISYLLRYAIKTFSFAAAYYPLSVHCVFFSIWICCCHLSNLIRQDWCHSGTSVSSEWIGGWYFKFESSFRFESTFKFKWRRWSDWRERYKRIWKSGTESKKRCGVNVQEWRFAAIRKDGRLYVELAGDAPSNSWVKW